MGTPSTPEKAMLICAMFSRHPDALEWAAAEFAREYGEVVLQSPSFEFSETKYYAATMGGALINRLAAFERLIDPGEIGRIKHAANRLEQSCAALKLHPEERPLNLDPGYLTLGKFVLATTKDAAHRIYLGAGIYAEITLRFQEGAWRDQPWTYPNYRRADYKEFLQRCRQRLAAERSPKIDDPPPLIRI